MFFIKQNTADEMRISDWSSDVCSSDLTSIGNGAPSARIRILLELAALRPGVEGIVLVSPDRHGGEPAVWWRIASEFAERGFAMLVIAGLASHTALGDAADATDTDTIEGSER